MIISVCSSVFFTLSANTLITGTRWGHYTLQPSYAKNRRKELYYKAGINLDTPLSGSPFESVLFSGDSLATNLTSTNLREVFNNRDARLLIMALALGTAAGFATILFHGIYAMVGSAMTYFVHGQVAEQTTAGRTYFSVVGQRAWLLPILTGAGASVAWLLQRYLTGQPSGHTTDAIIEAYHQGNGTVPRRLSWLTMVTASTTVASGGSAGLEGPAAMIGASLGSTAGRLLKLDDETMRLVVLMGVSAGLGAIFKAPIGAAFFAIEFLYRGIHFESEALIYTLVSAVAGFAVSGSFEGWSPEFSIPQGLALEHISQFFWFAVLGVSAGVIASIIPTFYFACKRFFAKLPGPGFLKPAAGGFLVGLIGIFVPQVTGTGTHFIESLMTVKMPLGMLVVYLVFKIVTFSFTLSSGGVGGVLSPSLFVGAVLGAVIATLSGGPLAPLVLVGMATIFAAAGRTPIASLLMVPEITGDYALLGPTALGVALCWLVHILLSEKTKHPTLHNAQPADLWSSPTHHAEVLTAGIQLLQQGGIQLPPDINLPDLEALLSIGYPVPLGAGGLIITKGELRAGSDAVGKTLLDSPFGPGVWLLEIRRGDRVLFPERTSVLEDGDTLVLLATTMQIPELARNLTFPRVFANWLARHEPETHRLWKEVVSQQS